MSLSISKRTVLLLASTALYTLSGHGQAAMNEPGAEATVMDPNLSSGLPAQAARPIDAFQGCETSDAPLAAVQDPRERIETAARTVDPISNREFVSFSLDELDTQTELPDGECWKRLDGVWRQDITISLDRSFTPEGWGSTKPELVMLANGTYTTPAHITVDPSSDSNAYLMVRDALNFSQPIRFDAIDKTDLSDVLIRNGARKTYQARGDTGGLGAKLTVDVTRSGYVRMKIGSETFFRPRPGTAKSDWDSQISNKDPFMIGFTMENLIASRRGYDVVTQNPDRLMDNPKAEIFARTERGYAIDERRIVPLGMRLVKEEMQGMVYYTELISSEREFQKMQSSNFGNSTRFGISGSASKTKTSDSNSKSGSVNIEAGYGWGSSSAKESFKSLRESNSVAKETGYMRFRKYALVADHPYIQLSDGFIDAVEDARRFGDYDALIEKFGTHYPYAISYGASGQLTQTIANEAYTEEISNSSSEESNSNASFVVGNTNSYSSENSRTGSSLREVNEYGERSFDAVGGNGSWSEAGFAAGDAHYPILADLRPIDDLLNPMNFPNEPEIYERVRIELARRVEAYLAANAELSEVSLLPEVEPIQNWTLRTSMLACDSAGSEPNSNLEIAGKLTLHRSSPAQYGSFPAMKLIDIRRQGSTDASTPVRNVNCARGRDRLVQTRTISGTAENLNRLRFRVTVDLEELDYAGAFDPDDVIKGQSGHFKLPIGKAVGHVEKQAYRLPPGNEGTHMGLHWTLTRTQ